MRLRRRRTDAMGSSTLAGSQLPRHAGRGDRRRLHLFNAYRAIGRPRRGSLQGIPAVRRRSASDCSGSWSRPAARQPSDGARTATSSSGRMGAGRSRRRVVRHQGRSDRLHLVRSATPSPARSRSGPSRSPSARRWRPSLMWSRRPLHDTSVPPAAPTKRSAGSRSCRRTCSASSSSSPSRCCSRCGSASSTGTPPTPHVTSSVSTTTSGRCRSTCPSAQQGNAGTEVLKSGYQVLANLDWFGQHWVIGARDVEFWLSLKNITIFLVLAVPLAVLPALVLSSMLASQLPGMKVFRAIYFIPSVAGVIGVVDRVGPDVRRHDRLDQLPARSARAVRGRTGPGLAHSAQYRRCCRWSSCSPG